MHPEAEANLDLHSASEDDEEEDMFFRGPADHSEDDADEEPDEGEQKDEDEDEPVGISKASIAYRAPPPGSQAQAGPSSKRLPTGIDDDSVTGKNDKLRFQHIYVNLYMQNQILNFTQCPVNHLRSQVHSQQHKVRCNEFRGFSTQCASSR